MKTRFFFALPVVAMFACATVANAAVCKAEVNKVVGVELASVNNVDAKVDGRLAKRTGSYDATLAANSIGIFGMNVNAKATSLTSGSKLDAKTESGFLTALQKGLDAETSAEVALQGVRDQIGSGMTSLENKIGVEAGAKAMTVASRIFVLSSNMSGYTA